jgi:hypothetical protein
LGGNELPNSYIGYILERLVGLQFPAETVDLFTLIFALMAFFISIKVNFFAERK